MAGCLIEECGVDQSDLVVYLAPCGTWGGAVPLDINGKPVLTKELLDEHFERTETENWSMSRNIVVNERYKTGRCGIPRCTAKIRGYTGSFGLCVCPTNKLHCELASQATDQAPCQFDWVVFPYPENCNMPDPATDAYWTGSGILSGADFANDPSADDDWTIEINWQGCNSHICEFNFCHQDDDTVVVDPTNCEELNTAINTALQEGLAA